MKAREVWHLLEATAQEWYKDNTFRLGAALAYYGVFALAPLAVLAVTIAGLVFGQQAAQGELRRQLEETLGRSVAGALEELIQQLNQGGSNPITWVVGLAVLFVAAASLFSELQGALDTIWGVQGKPGRGVLKVVWDRLLSFLLVLVSGLLLLLSLVVNTVLAFLAQSLHFGLMPGGAHLWAAVHVMVSLALLTVLFTLLYKVLPDVRLGWRDVWVGGAFTAVLFTAGNYVISWVLTLTGAVSVYGAAGSFVLVLMWIYYSSQVLLFGAELTKVYARLRGKQIAPADNAVSVTPNERAPQGLPGSTLGAES